MVLRILAGALLATVFWAAPGVAKAQDTEETLGPDTDSYAARAVQNRHYQGTHEITAFVGILPLDAFTKGVSFGGAYTLHLTDEIGWEVINYLYSVPFDTDLRDQLDPFDLEPTPFEVLEHLITTNLVFKPIYWKGSLLGDSIVYGEIAFVAGGGVGWFTRSQRVVVDYGISLRLYLARWLSIRLDVRHDMFFSDSIDNLRLDHELWTAFGISVQFG